MDVSVIVCTLNPRREYLRRVLDALDAQTLSKESWEFLLIDNASDERLSDTWDLSWHPHARHVREDKLGLTPARLRGIRESHGDIVLFVDDDNVLAPDYLQTAKHLIAHHPHLGVIGAGVIEPEFAVEPSRELLPYLGSLALRCVASARWGNNTDDWASVPWGAGLCVTRRVAQSYRPLMMQLGVEDLVDRRGKHHFGNGDVAFSWSSVMQGLGFGVFPQLHIVHLIPADRVTQGHFLQVAQDRGFASMVLEYLRAGIRPDVGRSRGEQLVRLALRGIRRGPFALRHSLAVSRGVSLAKAYIVEHCLQPVSRNEQV